MVLPESYTVSILALPESATMHSAIFNVPNPPCRKIARVAFWHCRILAGSLPEIFNVESKGTTSNPAIRQRNQRSTNFSTSSLLPIPCRIAGFELVPLFSTLKISGKDPARIRQCQNAPRRIFRQGVSEAMHFPCPKGLVPECYPWNYPARDF